MCLAVPAKISELRAADTAVAVIGGVAREINTALVDDLAVGDYVILHVGYALSKIDPLEAQRTLAIMESAGSTEASS